MSDVRRLGDRYQVGDLIGRGGMAEVHEGLDLRLGRRVAIKILKPELARDPAFLARFRREAQSAAALNHPNIVAVYDTGEDTLGEGPEATVVPFIVMELVEGRTLKDLIQSGSRLVPERSLEITSGVLAALDYSHRHGIIHRDIKPGNVMLTPAGGVKVMDFGIARATADAGQTATSTSTVLGTAAYLSPEQAQGRTVDARSDLYSTGVVLFELLTRRPPFIADAPVAVAFAHVNEEPPAPSSVDPSVPASLDVLVLKALGKDPEQRYQTAVEFRSAIERAIAGVPVTQILAPTEDGATAVLDTAGDSTEAMGAAATAGPTGPMQPVIPGGAGEPYQAPAPTEPPASSGLGRRLGIAAVVLGLVGLAVWLGLRLLTQGVGETVEVPALDGQTVAQATQRLSEVGLTLGREEYKASDRPKDTIIEQSPLGGTRADEGTPVDVVVSAGKEQAQVPDLVNFRSLAEVRSTLGQAGLSLGKVIEEDSDEPEETVLRQEPEAYEMVDAGSSVDVWISNATVRVPDVVGLSRAEARTALNGDGFEVDFAPARETDEASPGTVVDQSPGAGEKAKKGSVVTLTLAEAPPEPTPTSTPTTESPSEAPTPSDASPTDAASGSPQAGGSASGPAGSAAAGPTGLPSP